MTLESLTRTALSQEDLSNTRVLVNEWAKSRGLGFDNCIFCKAKHYPNHCPVLQGLLPKGALNGQCLSCYEYGHDVQTGECDIVKDVAFKSAGVCQKCLVPHQSKSCPLPLTAVRTCVIWVVNAPSTKIEFLDRMQREGRFQPKTEIKHVKFQELMRWCVLGNHEGLPNSYSLLAYVKGKLNQ